MVGATGFCYAALENLLTQPASHICLFSAGEPTFSLVQTLSLCDNKTKTHLHGGFWFYGRGDWI